MLYCVYSNRVSKSLNVKTLRKSILSELKRLASNDQGASKIEYSLLSAIVVIIAVLVLRSLSAEFVGLLSAESDKVREVASLGLIENDKTNVKQEEKNEVLVFSSSDFSKANFAAQKATKASSDSFSKAFEASTQPSTDDKISVLVKQPKFLKNKLGNANSFK